MRWTMGTFKVIIIYNLYNGMYGDECGYNGYNGLDLLGKVHTAKIMALLPPKCVGISSFFFFPSKNLRDTGEIICHHLQKGALAGA